MIDRRSKRFSVAENIRRSHSPCDIGTLDGCEQLDDLAARREEEEEERQRAKTAGGNAPRDPRRV